MRAFLAATAAGYAWAAAHPDEAVKLLVAPADPTVPGLEASQQRASDAVRASLAATAPVHPLPPPLRVLPTYSARGSACSRFRPAPCNSQGHCAGTMRPVAALKRACSPPIE